MITRFFFNRLIRTVKITVKSEGRLVSNCFERDIKERSDCM